MKWDKELEQFLFEYGKITEENRLIARDKFWELRDKFPLMPTDKKAMQWALNNHKLLIARNNEERKR